MTVPYLIDPACETCRASNEACLIAQQGRIKRQKANSEAPLTVLFKRILEPLATSRLLTHQALFSALFISKGIFHGRNKQVWSVLYVQQNAAYINQHPERPFPIYPKCVYLPLQTLNMTMNDNDANPSLIILAAQRGCIDLVDLILTHTATVRELDANRDIWPPLGFAVRKGFEKTINVLVKHSPQLLCWDYREGN